MVTIHEPPVGLVQRQRLVLIDDGVLLPAPRQQPKLWVPGDVDKRGAGPQGARSHQTVEQREELRSAPMIREHATEEEPAPRIDSQVHRGETALPVALALPAFRVPELLSARQRADAGTPASGAGAALREAGPKARHAPMLKHLC